MELVGFRARRRGRGVEVRGEPLGGVFVRGLRRTPAHVGSPLRGFQGHVPSACAQLEHARARGQTPVVAREVFEQRQRRGPHPAAAVPLDDADAQSFELIGGGGHAGRLRRRRRHRVTVVKAHRAFRWFVERNQKPRPRHRSRHSTPRAAVGQTIWPPPPPPPRRPRRSRALARPPGGAAEDLAAPARPALRPRPRPRFRARVPEIRTPSPCPSSTARACGAAPSCATRPSCGRTA